MKYPYIGKDGTFGCIILFTNPEFGYCIDGGASPDGREIHTGFVGKWSGDWNEGDFESIAHGYLSNTKVRIESPEHSALVQQLAFNAGYKWQSGAYVKHEDKQFLYFWCGMDIRYGSDHEGFDESIFKEITIPMTPQGIAPTATKEEEFEMTQIEKNNGDNLIFAGESIKESRVNAKELRKEMGCDDSLLSDKCKEWPTVGDEVVVRIDAHQWDVKYGHEADGKKGVIRSVFKDGEVDVYAVSVDGVCYCFVKGLLQKPKTPEQELRDEIASDLNKMQLVDNRFKAGELMAKYNITKKPQ